jgi:hypothetical protein
MDAKRNFVSGMPDLDVDPEEVKVQLRGVMQQAALGGAPALDTFTQLQQRRVARLKKAGTVLKSKLGKDHPAVLEIEALEKSTANLKVHYEKQTTRLKRFPKLHPNEWIVFGVVTDPQGNPASSLTVRVFDKDRKYDDLLGETETGESGDFFVIYHERDFKETGENLPDLYLMINDPSGKAVYSSRDSIRYEAGRMEYFKIVLKTPPRPAKPKPAKPSPAKRSPTTPTGVKRSAKATPAKRTPKPKSSGGTGSGNAPR